MVEISIINQITDNIYVTFYHSKSFFSCLLFCPLFYMMTVEWKAIWNFIYECTTFWGKKDYPLQSSPRECPLFPPSFYSHIFMNVSNLFLCSGNEIGFKFICHKYGMYSLIFSCGESFLCCRVTCTAAVIKMFVRFSLLCYLPVLEHLLY